MKISEKGTGQGLQIAQFADFAWNGALQQRVAVNVPALFETIIKIKFIRTIICNIA